MHAISIYSSELIDRLPVHVFDDLLSEIPETCRNKALRARKWQDAQNILVSRLLLKKALEDLGGAMGPGNLRYSSFGRPYLEGGPDFNWSHSESRVVCAASCDTRVGIDIEYIRPIDFTVYKDLFASEEWNQISDAPDPLQRFHREWTMKEAVLKADGRGLSVNIHDVKKISGTENRLQTETWFLREIPLSGGYSCHLASKSKAPILNYHSLQIV